MVFVRPNSETCLQILNVLYPKPTKQGLYTSLSLFFYLLRVFNSELNNPKYSLRINNEQINNNKNDQCKKTF